MKLFMKMNKDSLKRLLKTEYIVLFLILLTGVFLRFKGLLFQSLWLDELISIMSSAPSESLGDIVAHYQGDPHPPLYFFILHFWMAIFGFNELSARLLTAIIGSLSVWSVYLLGKESFNKNTGLIAAALTALNLFNLRYSQEVRPYIMFFLAAALAYLFFIRLLKEQTRKNIILYAAASAFMIYIHYFGLFILLSQAVFVLFYLFSEEGTDRLKIIKSFALSGVLTVILYSPWIPTVLRMMKRKGHWIKDAPGSDFFLKLFRSFFGGEPYLVILFGGLILGVVFYFIFARKDGVTDEAAAARLNLALPVIFSWLFFSLFIPYFRSLTTIPMFINRYAIGTLPAVILLAAVGLELVNKRLVKHLLITSIILVSFVSIFYHRDYYNTVAKAQWRSVVDMVINDKEEKGNIYVVSNAARMFQFYFKSQNSDIKVLPPDVKVLRKILRQDKTPKEFWVISGESSVKYTAEFNAFLNKNFKSIRKEQFRIAQGKLWAPKSQDPNLLTDQYVQRVIDTRGAREYDVWLPGGETPETLSPSFFPISKKGEFAVEVVPGGEAAPVLTVRNIAPDKDGQCWANIGYEINRAGLDVPIPEGKYVHMAVTAAASPKLMNKINYFVLSGFDGKRWMPSKKAFFNTRHFRTYILSKKVRPGCKRLFMSARFTPASPKDVLKIRKVRIFVTDKPL